MRACLDNLNTILCLIIVSVTYGSHIQFHKGDHKRSYLVFESNGTSKCNNIPRKLLTEWNFVKTDTCMMVYNDFHCRSLTSGRFEPGTSFTRDFLIYSFHICNENEGGLQLNLDLTEYYSGSGKLPRVLQSYKDVCKCINIPRNVIDMDYWSLNNHGNELYAYYEPNCLEKVVSATFILDGQSYESRNIYHLKKSNKKILSVGPEKNSTYFYNSCLKMGTVTLPTVDLSKEKEEIENPKRNRYTEAQTSKSDVEALIRKHTEEIKEIYDKNRALQAKLDQLKMNIDLILAKQKEAFQAFADKIKEDLKKAYAKGKDENSQTEAPEQLEDTTDDDGMIDGRLI